MTDKERIRNIVELFIAWNGETEVIDIANLDSAVEFIEDSLPEEPVSDVWHDTSEHPEIDRTFLLVAPNGNSSLCLWGGKELHSVTLGGGHSLLCPNDKWAYIDDLLHKQEEPVSNSDWLTELQEKLDNATPKQLEELWNKYNGVDEEEPVSEDLDKAVVEYMSQFSGENYYNSPWVMDSTGMAMPKELARFGASWQKEQMMAKAIDVKVKVDAGDYPYIPQMELYDYDKDIPLAKAGEKYKVVLIKED